MKQILWHLGKLGLLIFYANALAFIGALASLFLIASVGSQFSPTYAALATATIASIVSPVLVLAFAFNLHTATLSIDWILWASLQFTILLGFIMESIYTGSFAFLFLINTITMTYSSIRWAYTYWWLASIVCFLVTIAFILDSALLISLQWKNPLARHSQNDIPASYR
uniref:Integral membrane protein n=1 Tax=Heterorhabditis bacteriophora TaxID=37862 RepID=A0A1I7XHB0_HETBA